MVWEWRFKGLWVSRYVKYLALRLPKHSKVKAARCLQINEHILSSQRFYEFELFDLHETQEINLFALPSISPQGLQEADWWPSSTKDNHFWLSCTRRWSLKLLRRLLHQFFLIQANLATISLAKLSMHEIYICVASCWRISNTRALNFQQHLEW